MIKLKLKFLDDGPANQEVEIEDGEILKTAVARVCKDIPPMEGKDILDFFNVVVNGNIIDKEFWEVTALKVTDTVVISPKIEGGDSGAIFKQFAIIVITVVATYFLGPAGAGLTGVWLGVATAAVTISSSLLLNALIPPPSPGMDGGGFNFNPSYEQSQMYSINGQSNNVKRFATVPKTYGRHRTFPNVAAFPFTQLEVDTDGSVVQYLYAIYDFGFGPGVVSDLQIGDTPLDADNFNNFIYNWVDLNKPAIAEGPWDDAVQDRFTLYKGDFDSANISIGLDGNKVDDDAQETWEGIRNSADNPDGTPQEILLTFVNQQGLYSFNSLGEKGFRTIDLDISFSKADEDVWKKYNDMTYVSAFDSAGGDTSAFELNMDLANPYPLGGTAPVNNDYYQLAYAEEFGIFGNFSQNHFKYYYRITPGTTKLLVFDNGFGDVAVGQPVKLNNNIFLGNVLTVEEDLVNPDFLVITLDRPVDYGGIVWTFAQSWNDNLWRVAENLGSFLRFSNATLGRARIKKDDTSATYSSFRFTPLEAGQYKIRVQRLSTTTDFTTTVADALTWNGLTTRFAREPIITNKRHLFLEIKIKATSQINGNIQDLSGIVSSALDVYDPDAETWTKQLTNNPAWVFVDLMTSEINKKAVAKTRLHMDSIVEWAEFCDEVPDSPPDRDYTHGRFECNFVLDYSTTLQDILNQVGNAAQASLNIVDGKYGVLIDKFRSTPVQIFTPRNSRDFQSIRVYGPRPQGVKVKYIDPGQTWGVTEFIVYDDGFDANTATDDDLDELTSFACTNDEQAYRFGRYMMAQNRLRQETISILVDFENLVCTRGDFVQITQDVMRAGGTPARVKSVVGNRVVIDQGVDLIGGPWGYVVRLKTGEIKTSTTTPVDAHTFDLAGDLPTVGDLIVIGEVGEIVFDCIVKAITPNDDMTATIALVEKADAIYDAESSGVIPEYNPHISSTSNPNLAPGPVENLAITANTWRCASGGGYEYYVDLQYNAPGGSVPEYYFIYVNSGKGFEQVGQAQNGFFTYIVDQDDLDIEHQFKVLAVSASGKKLPLGSVTAVTATPEAKVTPPSDISRLSTDITNEVLQLTLQAVADCDIAQYLIRFSTETTNARWESSVPLLFLDGNTTLASTQARTGTYLAKAVDFNGNESVNAALAVTTIPNLFNLNVVETINEAPDFDGVYDRTDFDAGSILLAKQVSGTVEEIQYYAEGFYNFSDLIDLGSIMTVRLQSRIQAEGFIESDLMINWETLSDVTLMATARGSEWNIETQYRSTDQLDVMANWVTLDSIEALGAGTGEDFTDWRTFYIGDATGRVFQFRLKLISNKPAVTPRVFDGTIIADMVDRFESFNNLTVDAVDGYELIYPNAFFGPGTSPNVQVSIETASSGDYWTFDYKNLTGLLIRVFDKDDNPVERVVDIAVKGYGRQSGAVI